MAKHERASRIERRGWRWWWVCEAQHATLELGPFWFRRNCVKHSRLFDGWLAR